VAGPAPQPFNKGLLLLVFAGVSAVIVTAWLVLGQRAEAPVTVETVKVDPQGPERPIAFYLAQADAARGERFFRGRCGVCHTIETGAPQGIGPNLVGVMGNNIASRPEYGSYSTALAQQTGDWDWETTSRFLRSPRAFAPGTRMAFAGVTDPQDRADVMLYMNGQGGSLPNPAGAR